MKPSKSKACKVVKKATKTVVGKGRKKAVVVVVYACSKGDPVAKTKWLIETCTSGVVS